MTAQIVRSKWSDTPAITPHVSTLLDHASIVEGLDYVDDRGMVDSFNCLDMAVPTTLCPDVPGEKDFEAPHWIDGIVFAVYGGISCKPFGFSEERGLSKIEEAFRLKESVGVERALMQSRFVDGPDDDPGAGVDLRWTQAEDLTPGGGPVSAEVGLALLEGRARSIYAGVPTLHIPGTIASLLASQDRIVVEAGKAYTKLGSKVAIGGGYEYPNNGPDGVDTDGSTLWLYATGEVFLARSPQVAVKAMDTTNNDIYALAERAYVAAIDCFAAAVEVTVA